MLPTEARSRWRCVSRSRPSRWKRTARTSQAVAYLKVVVEADGEEVTTAHWDRGFARRMKRRQEE